MATTDKVCNHCRQEKEYTEFYTRTTYDSGRDNVCKVCRRKENALNRKVRKAKLGITKRHAPEKVTICDTCYAYVSSVWICHSIK